MIIVLSSLGISNALLFGAITNFVKEKIFEIDDGELMLFVSNIIVYLKILVQLVHSR